MGYLLFKVCLIGDFAVVRSFLHLFFFSFAFLLSFASTFTSRFVSVLQNTATSRRRKSNDPKIKFQENIKYRENITLATDIPNQRKYK